MSKPSPSTSRLLDYIHYHNDCVIHGTEEWSTQYRKDKKSFGKIVKIQSFIQRQMRSYLSNAPARLDRLIRWPEYTSQTVKGADDDDTDFVVDIDSSGWDDEEQELLVTLYEPVTQGLGAGVEAGLAFYGRPVGELASQSYLQKAAADHVAQLVKGVNNTTRDRLVNSIQTSLKLGESVDQARDRIASIIDDPARAETIARTESVNAYQAGMLSYGNATGSTTKTWQTAADPCPICEGNESDGDLDMDDTFSSGDDSPPAHPNCQCGLILNYPDGSEDEDDSE